MKQKTWKDYFHFSKSERNGIYIVIALILIVGSLNFIIPRFAKNSSIDFSTFKQEISRLKENEKTKGEDNDLQPEFEELNTVNYSLFEFDPNRVNREQLLSLGVKSYVIDNLLKYRNKGGRFKKKEELKKIFGFDLETYKRLEPYIFITESKSREHEFEKAEESQAGKEIIQMDINASTAVEFQQIRGIGEVYSKRIVDYRELLGGYNSIDQILEVYGIDSTLFNSIKNQLIIQEINLKQISLNFAGIRELSAHPYIDYALAKKMYNERVKNGPYHSMDDLNTRCLKDDVLIEKISPYLQIWQ